VLQKIELIKFDSIFYFLFFIYLFIFFFSFFFFEDQVCEFISPGSKRKRGESGQRSETKQKK